MRSRLALVLDNVAEQVDAASKALKVLFVIEAGFFEVVK